MVLDGAVLVVQCYCSGTVPTLFWIASTVLMLYDQWYYFCTILVVYSSLQQHCSGPVLAMCLVSHLYCRRMPLLRWYWHP